MPDRPPILFYDGECGLCHRTVRWVLKRDRAGVIRFAPLQGSTYATIAIRDKPMDVSTIVFVDGSEALTRGDAVLAYLRRMGGIWPALATCGAIVPRPLRDALYRFVARRRRAWYGRANACDLPSQAHAARFLP